MISADVERSAILFLFLSCPLVPPFGAGEMVGVNGLEPFCVGRSLIVSTVLLDFFFFVIFAKLRVSLNCFHTILRASTLLLGEGKHGRTSARLLRDRATEWSRLEALSTLLEK